ncbi:hypothetical protein BDV36DRAFT_268161 [Aspergillus pseudocaelatus]|uniref:Uncharacterized protein n=1 Tax=Aspergillus pseudocaelatus TaxID=1825620 RepID=A0ABQ6W8X1_9EURO|nr:hypothetical protein BDV36DRAFT_268161 [Aspergillus pseudocaelatus]
MHADSASPTNNKEIVTMQLPTPHRRLTTSPLNKANTYHNSTLSVASSHIPYHSPHKPTSHTAQLNYTLPMSHLRSTYTGVTIDAEKTLLCKCGYAMRRYTVKDMGSPYRGEQCISFRSLSPDQT